MGWEGITWGEMPDIGDGGREAANHIAMYVLMQKSCMNCTCTQNLKYNLKRKTKKKMKFDTLQRFGRWDLVGCLD